MKSSACVVVREAGSDDADALLEHLEHLIEEPGINVPLAPGELGMTLERELAFIEECRKSDYALFLVAEVNGTLVGCLDFRGIPRKALRHCVELEMSVREGYRGMGVGDALIQRGMDWARANELIHRVELYVYARNKPAIRLYEKHGFEREGLRRHMIYQDGEYLDDLNMAALLS